jgi:hypothetical protein
MKFDACESVSHLYPVMAVIAILVMCALCTTGATALAAQPPDPQAAYLTLTTADDWRSGGCWSLHVKYPPYTFSLDCRCPLLEV